MMMDRFGGGGPDYEYCTYRDGGPVFRGPAHGMEGEFIAAIGGTETFGRFVAQPFPALIGQMTAVPVANLGVPHASAALFCAEEALIAAAARARIVIVQLGGVEGLPNPYYRVHPRRNDRLLSVSDRLRGLYPGIDYTQICFVRHLLSEVKAASPDHFRRIRDELRREWSWRYRELLERLACPVVLLWISRRRPDRQTRDLGRDDPLFVDRRMIEGLRPYADDVVEVQLGPEPDTRGMVLGPLDAPAAERLPGPRAHAEIAMALYDSLIRVAGGGPYVRRPDLAPPDVTPGGKPFRVSRSARGQP